MRMVAGWIFCLVVTLPLAWAEQKQQQGELAFSAMSWEGEYTTTDIPGGVKSTPTQGKIYIIRDDGSDPGRVIVPVKNATYPGYSRDGKWIYFQSNEKGRHHVYRCTSGGKDVEILSNNRDLSPKWTSAYGHSTSADGSRLLYTVHDGESGRIVLADGDGGHPKILFPDLGYAYMGSLSPKGDRIVFSGPARSYRLMIADLPTGTPRELTPDHPESYVPQFTPDGKTIVFIRRDGDVYRVDTDGKNLKRLTMGNEYVEFRLSPRDSHGSSDGPHVSPDGSRIAYIARKKGIPQVCVMNLDGSNQRQLTNRPAACGRVKWSPNGKKVAFVSFDGKYPQLFTMSADGGEPRQMTHLESAVYFITWKPSAD